MTELSRSFFLSSRSPRGSVPVNDMEYQDLQYSDPMKQFWLYFRGANFGQIFFPSAFYTNRAEGYLHSSEVTEVDND